MRATLMLQVGALTVGRVRDVEVPRDDDFGTQLVRVEPGTYDVFAFVSRAYMSRADPGGLGPHRAYALTALAEGPVVGADGLARESGLRGVARIELPIFGRAGEVDPLRDATLSDLLVRHSWDPRDHDPSYTGPRMWRVDLRPGIELNADDDTGIARVVDPDSSCSRVALARSGVGLFPAESPGARRADRVALTEWTAQACAEAISAVRERLTDLRGRDGFPMTAGLEGERDRNLSLALDLLHREARRLTR